MAWPLLFCPKIIREKNMPFYEKRNHTVSLLFLNKFERRLICGKTRKQVSERTYG